MQTFPNILYNHYTRTPDQVAVHLLFSRGDDRTITYRQLIEGAAGYAETLTRRGVVPGEVAILILDHGEDLFCAFFGAVLHGAIPSIMPFLTEKLSPEHYRKSLAALFEITAPAAVVTLPGFEEEVRGAITRESSVREVVLTSEAAPARGISPPARTGWGRSPDDIVFLQHSSGTTGLQKGVALSHQAVFNQLESYSRAIRLNTEDVVVSWLPLYHDMGLIAGFLLPVLRGAPLVLMSPFDWVRAPFRLMQAVSRYGGTLTWLPNFAYNFCAQKVRDRHLEGVDLSSWRAVINCSEPMYAESHRMFLERFRGYGLRPEALATCYAMAENVFAVTQDGIGKRVTEDVISAEGLAVERIARAPLDGETHIAMLSAGPPIENVEVCVLGEKRERLPERRIGEIALRSNCMLTGYYRRPDVTAKSFHEGWYLTGDLGYVAGGELYVTGRKKDLIIVGGKNVYPQDVEYLASEVEGVHPGRVAAFGVHNKRAGTEDMVVVAEVGTEDEAERQRIADEIRQRVTKGSAVALRFVKVVGRGWLLKTSSGKVARGANREKYLGEGRESKGLAGNEVRYPTLRADGL
ncbi:MAG: AMP-binding protein [Anaerolineales bacterium]